MHPPTLSRLSIIFVLVSLLLLGTGQMAPRAIALTGTILAETGTMNSGTMNSGATKKLPPNLANALHRDLSKRVKLPIAKLRIVEAVPKTWPDGCLGLARPDEFCTQALVSGWRVVLSDGSKRWVYRTDNQGRIMRFEKLLPA